MQTAKHGDSGPAGRPPEQKQLTILLSALQLTMASLGLGPLGKGAGVLPGDTVSQSNVNPSIPREQKGA